MPADADTAVTLAQKMFTPTAQGDGFQQKYFDAIQSDPNVVMEHGELARLFVLDNLQARTRGNRDGVRLGSSRSETQRSSAPF